MIMSKSPRNWTYRIQLSPRDHLNLRAVVVQERKYFNGLITALNGPLRTMSDTLKTLGGAYETVFGEIAATGQSVDVVMAADRFRSVVRNPKVNLILEAARASGVIHPDVRRVMAVEVLRTARETSAAMHNTLMREDQVYRHAVETLSVHDDRTKRHVQLPRSLVEITEAGQGNIAIRTPYTTTDIIVYAPRGNWTIMTLREDEGNWWVMELSDTASGYLVRKSDPAGRKRPARAQHRGENRQDLRPI
jgi:hypothetical protein